MSIPWPSISSIARVATALKPFRLGLYGTVNFATITCRTHLDLF